MEQWLADELGGMFEDVPLSPTGPLNGDESPEASLEEVVENAKNFGIVVSEGEQPAATQSNSTSPTIVDTDFDFPATFVVDDDEHSAVTKTDSDAALGQTPRKSNFVEHLTPNESAPKPSSQKEHTVLLASKHNRDLIERDANGFFKMETMPTAIDVQRRIQQSKGIAALQRTLIPATLSDTASTSTSSSQASSSIAMDSVKRPSTLRQVTFAESKGRRPNKIQGPYPYTANRTKAASRFSLGRDLVAAGHKKRLSMPSAPARFIRLPTDPVVSFKRNFGERGLKVRIPEPDLNDAEGESGSITTIPDVDSTGSLKLKRSRSEFDEDAESKARNVGPKLEFGGPRSFVKNQCLEPTCPIKWAHAKGPYHHMGKRHNKIMTGLFGHSNPPPAIWNAYRNMVHLTSDGEVISPDERPQSKAEHELVISFAIFHFGGLNGMSGQEFHRRYAGQHISSRIAIQSLNNESSNWSWESDIGSLK